jgi:SAM-dependent methyltransferase
VVVIRELLHFARHAPSTVALKLRSSQDELYDTLIHRADAAGLADRRAELARGLSGTVVEIGAGTGAMFPHYPPDTQVIAVEPDEAFAARARASAPRNVEVVSGTGESLPLADGEADAAVLALVLCSVADPGAVCREIARVVKPGGQIRLIEHVISERRVAGALMHAVNPVWLALNGQGCRLDRDPLPPLRAAGLHVDRVEPFQIWSAGLPAFPFRWIAATRR